LFIYRDKNESLNSRLALLREHTAEEAKVISKVENENKEFEMQLSNLNNQQAEIKDECAKLKSINNQLKENLSVSSLQFEESTALRKKLSSNIVNSPERFRKQIVDVGQALQTEQKDSKTAEKKIRELNNWLTNIEEAQIEVNGGLSSIQELRSGILLFIILFINIIY
jgi:kinetochore protein Nuf2